MNKNASDILNDLETRVAHLEKTAKVNLSNLKKKQFSPSNPKGWSGVEVKGSKVQFHFGFDEDLDPIYEEYSREEVLKALFSELLKNPSSFGTRSGYLSDKILLNLLQERFNPNYMNLRDQMVDMRNY